MKKKDLDWAAVGLDSVGGDVPKRGFTAKDLDLKGIQAALEAALVLMKETPELDVKPFEEIAAKLFVLQEKHAQLRRDCWINHLRFFAAGAIVTWVLWDLLGK